MVSEARICVLGTGDSGTEHIKAIAASPRARLHTICSTPRSARKAVALKEKHGAERVTTRYEDVLEDPDIDVVIICTPNSQHPSQAIPALNAGKHTYVEKPLAVDLPGAEAIVEAARRSGRAVQVGQDLRFVPMFETVKALVEQGRLGAPCYIVGEFVEDLQPNIDGPTHDWYLDFENEGQLPIFCAGGRLLDMMRWVVGEIEEVTAWGTNRNLPKAPWHDTVVANVRFVNGALGKFAISAGAKVPDAHNLSYYGTLGTVINNKLFLGGVPHVQDFMEIPVPLKVEPQYVYRTALNHFLDCIETGARPRIDAVDGARTVAACCAVADSIASGQPEKVHLIPDGTEDVKPGKVMPAELRAAAEMRVD